MIYGICQESSSGGSTRTNIYRRGFGQPILPQDMTLTWIMHSDMMTTIYRMSVKMLATCCRPPR
eukprot:scaffold10190_cov294-Chaetoceros_neogracile.AAC.13